MLLGIEPILFESSVAQQGDAAFVAVRNVDQHLAISGDDLVIGGRLLHGLPPATTAAAARRKST